MDTYADQYGFITWRSVADAVTGAELAAEKAREAADNADWVGAVRINLCILEEMVDMLQVADDSDGTVGYVIEECLQHIRELTLESDRFHETDCETLFRLLLEASKQSRFEGWTDWQLALLANSSQLAVTVDLRKDWDDDVSRMISGKKGDNWSHNYFAERVALMRYHLIRTYENEDQAR